MVRFAVNISTIFTETSFLERFDKVKQHGFSFVECQFPYAYQAEEIKQKLQEHDLKLVLINLPPGNWDQGDRGLACDPARIESFKQSVEEGIAYATRLGVPRIHCMAGIIPNSVSKETARKTFSENIKYAARKFAKHDIILVIEPINQYDMPNYFLSDIDEAIQIMKEANEPNVKLQFDFYHIERIHGQALVNFEKCFDFIEHVQIADVPGRHEPNTGEMDYNKIFQRLEQLQYKGFIGLEYNPKFDSDSSFSWMKE